MLRKLRKNAGVAILALLVAGLFLSRRISGPGGGGDPFDPSDFHDAPIVSADAASGMLGQRAVVCGRVAAVTFAVNVGGQPTFINLERPFPDQAFDAVIWGRDRAHWEVAPEQLYDGSEICVAGRVRAHDGVPRIEVRVPAQIRFGPLP